MCLVRPEQQLMVLPRAMAAGTAAARAAKPAPPIGSGAFPAAGGAIGAQPAFGAQGQAAPGLPIPAFGFGAAVQPPPSNLTVSALKFCRPFRLCRRRLKFCRPFWLCLPRLKLCRPCRRRLTPHISHSCITQNKSSSSACNWRQDYVLLASVL